MKQKVPISGAVWQSNVEEAISLIEANESFLFCGDIDPDSVGSMLSMALYLRLLNKQAYLVISETLSENLDYMEKIIDYNSIKILRGPDDIRGINDHIDIVIFCDTANTKLVPFYSVIREKLSWLDWVATISV